MSDIVHWLNDSRYLSSISPACEMCAHGSKMVLLITGICSSKCYYCPLSFEKFGKDRIFADEWELIDETNTDVLLKEAEYIKAEGAGITGGDPLIVWKRTKNFISLLKNNFGEKFHIHLYTSGLKNSKYIDDFVSVGLDEIRFHPSVEYWSCMDSYPINKVINDLLKTDVDVAIEIPVIPEMKNDIILLIRWADDLGIKWINLNELEFSEKNVDYFNHKNYELKNDISSAVKNSQETAYEILSKFADEQLDIGIHYCSCSFKDGIQLRNRIIRRAKSIVKDHELISEDGTLIKGVLAIDDFENLDKILRSLKEEFRISENNIFINYKKKRIEMDFLNLNKIAISLLKKGIKSYLIEEYPTADELEVEKIPLPI